MWEYEGSAALSAAIVAGMLAVITWHARRLEAGRRMIFFILAGSGVCVAVRHAQPLRLP